MKTLDRKLLRDLRHLLGQVVTIALVVACGIASYVTLQSTWESLETSKVAYYERWRFGHVFAHLERAPESVAQRLEAIPGVARVSTRVVESVRLPIESAAQPPLAEVVSLPETGQPPLNQLVLQAGRMVERGRADEAVLLTSFAQRRRLTPGDTLPAVINGERRELVIVGLASSPEFVYPMPRGGAIGVDDERFAVLWMDRAVVAAAFRMEGAFNDVVLALQPGASEPAVLGAVDRVLDPYGGRSAVGRSRQPSNDVLEEEMEQLRVWATVVPLIFLGVSVFLVNVVLSRLVHLQRPEIAALKALGYGDLAIGLHYLKLVTVVVLLGTVIGIVIGAWLGGALTGVYADVFRFPFAAYRLGPGVVLAGAAASFVTAAAGALAAVRRIALLPPAEAMRPPAPAVYRPLLVERLGIQRLVPPAVRMILRELERQPLRTVLSVLGIATALATLVVGRFADDAFDYLIDMQFSRITREDLTVAFERPVPPRAVRALAHLPAVTRAEGVRVAPARLQAGHRYREVPIYGYDDASELRHVVGRRYREPVPLPADGVLLTRTLAELLGVEPGDSVAARILEGDWETHHLAVAGVVDELMGLQGYMRLPALNRLLDEAPSVSMALLAVDRRSEAEVIRRLNDMPAVASVTSRAAVIAALREQSGESMAVVTLVLTIFAATIAVGVVYNNARVALSTRERDFASLRVLGFTRAEISRILLGELGVQVAAAIPFGLLLGTWLTQLVLQTAHPERFRFPVVISARTYAFAALVVVASSAVSGLLVRRRVDRLDLIGVLKTRE
ncbi:MAG TPA: ABC transporter permease [Gemmatimonadales bacterium]|nr:ABC transporter permease [Gemmatimonadales bacterium]